LINRLSRRTGIAALSMLLVSCTSSGFPVDDESCEFYGDTIWDKCWWFNNSWIFGIGIAGALYGLGWKYIYSQDQKGKKVGGAFGGMLYFFIGTGIALMGALFLTMLFEKMLTNS
jgi:hypothetical protein